MNIRTFITMALSRYQTLEDNCHHGYVQGLLKSRQADKRNEALPRPFLGKNSQSSCAIGSG